MKPAVRRQDIEREAKAIVALAFRNGPIEQVHAGRTCPTCTGREGYSRITDDEMKSMMTNAVNHVYKLLVLKAETPRNTSARFSSAHGTRCGGMSRKCQGGVSHQPCWTC